MISPLRPRPLLASIAAAVLALGVVGCAADDPDPSPSRSGSGSASTEPSASPSASPTPSSMPTAQAGITPDSIGGYALGSPLTSAAKALGASPEQQCPWVYSVKKEWTTWLAADAQAADPSDSIELIAIDSSGSAATPAGAPKTASGIGLGSTLAAVKAAYPSAKSVDAVNADFALRYVEGGGSIVFEGRGDVVQSITVLPASAENPSDHCG